MVVSPLTAFASEETTPDDGTSHEVGETFEVDGDATVRYYPKDVKVVTLPTSAALEGAFTIDPQGALSITKQGDVASDEAVGAAVMSKISVIKNQSSFPIDVDMLLYVSNGDDDGTASTVNLVDTAPSEDDINNDLFLNLYHTGNDNFINSNLKTLNAATKDYTLIDNEAFGENIINIQANGKANAMEIDFQLKQAEYALTQTDEDADSIAWTLKSDPADNYSQVAFGFGGNVAQNADWSAYGSNEGQEPISMSAVFTLTKIDTDPADSVTIDYEYAEAPTYFDNNGDVTDITTTNDGISASLDAGAIASEAAPQDLDIAIDLGKGGQKVTVTEVWLGKTELTMGTDYEVTSTGITLKPTEADWILLYATDEPEDLGIGLSNEVWIDLYITTSDAE
jgi:hypothetical protein